MEMISKHWAVPPWQAPHWASGALRQQALTWNPSGYFQERTFGFFSTEDMTLSTLLSTRSNPISVPTETQMDIHTRQATSCLVAQLFPTLLWRHGLYSPGSSVHGILQARILEQVAMPFSRGSSWHRDQTQVSCTAGRFFTTEPPETSKVSKCTS